MLRMRGRHNYRRVSPRPRSTDGDDGITVRDKARIKRHNCNLHTDFGALSEHAEGIRHDFRWIHPSALRADAAFYTAQYMCC